MYSTTGWPILEVEYVAERIIRAIRLEQRVLMLPRMIYVLYAIKGYTLCLCTGCSKKRFEFSIFLEKFEFSTHATY